MRKRKVFIAVLGCVIILGSTGSPLRGMERSFGLTYGRSWALRGLPKYDYSTHGGWSEYYEEHLTDFLSGYIRLAGPRFGILFEFYAQNCREQQFQQINSISPPQVSSPEGRNDFNVLALAIEYQILPFSNKKWLPFIGAGIWIPFQGNWVSFFSPGFVKNDVFGRLGIRWRPVKPLGVLAAMDYLVKNSILVFKCGLEIWL